MKVFNIVRRHWILIALMLIALALRIWYLTINPLWPQFSNADDGDYFQRALRFAVTGRYVDDGWLIRPPFHVWIFAGWLKLALEFGQSASAGVRLIQGFQTLLGVALVPLGYALAARLFNRRAGLIFAGFCALWFPFVELPATLFSEPIYLFLFTLHLWLLLRFDDTRRLHNLVLSGLVLGMAALTRSPALYALVFAVPWLVIKNLEPRTQNLTEEQRTKSKEQTKNLEPRTQNLTEEQGNNRTKEQRTKSKEQSTATPLRLPQPRRKSAEVRGKVPGDEGQSSSRLLSTLYASIRRSIAPFAVLSACTLAIVLPWTARNWIVYHRFVAIDTLGPINLWLDLEGTELRTQKIEQLRQLPQADRQAFATEKVREILSVEPLRPLRNVWPTFRHVWKAQYVEDLWVKSSFFTRPLREAAPLGLASDLFWLIAAFAGLLGLLHPATDRAFKVLIGLWLVYSFATVLVFHVEPRYLLPIWLLLALYGSWTLSAGIGWIAGLRRQPWRAALVYGAVLAIAALFITYRDYPSIIAQGLRRDWHMRSGDQAYARADYPAAEREYRAALDADPQFVDSEIPLALALAAQGRSADARAVLSPGDSRRSGIVAGLLSRDAGDEAQARTLLSTVEQRAGEDAQRWTLDHVPVRPRAALVLGQDALDLGYIVGFAGSEQAGDLSYRWLLGSGEIVLPLIRPLAAGDSIGLTLAAPLPLTGPLQVRINGGPAILLRPDPQWREYRLVIPPALADQTELRLSLSAPTYLPMREEEESDDPRSLSVMVHRVVVYQ
ncbi:MAG TPA: glycosyltransferase family 39 protein [Herpetosiphonaceae bacterium]